MHILGACCLLSAMRCGRGLSQIRDKTDPEKANSCILGNWDTKLNRNLKH